jgi:hypothetical protein
VFVTHPQEAHSEVGLTIHANSPSIQNFGAEPYASPEHGLALDLSKHPAAP